MTYPPIPNPGGPAFSSPQAVYRAPYRATGNNPEVNLASNFGSVCVGIFLAVHACYAPEYLALISGLALPIAAVLTLLVALLGLSAGRMGRFLGVKISLVYFLLLFLWVASLLLFTWKNEWGGFLQYALRYHLLPLFFCSILLSFRSIRMAMNLYALGFVVHVGLIAMFGSVDSAGRFGVQKTSMQNPNDLAFNLLFGFSILSSFLIRGSFFLRLITGSAMLVTIYFVLRTGSRASMITLLVISLVLLVISNLRTRVMIFSGFVLVLLAGAVMLPQQILTRLVTISSADAEDLQADSNLQGAIGSTEARLDLQRRAIQLAMANPILGVGPTMYMPAMNDLMIKEGFGKGRWQVAHNTFLQIAAETGFISFLLYVGVVLWCIRVNYVCVKSLRSRTDKAGLDALAQSYALLLSSIVYAVGTNFCSIPYWGQFPMLVGLTAASWLTIREAALLGQQPAQAPAPRSTASVPAGTPMPAANFVPRTRFTRMRSVERG